MMTIPPPAGVGGCTFLREIAPLEKGAVVRVPLPGGGARMGLVEALPDERDRLHLTCLGEDGSGARGFRLFQASVPLNTQYVEVTGLKGPFGLWCAQLGAWDLADLATKIRRSDLTTFFRTFKVDGAFMQWFAQRVPKALVEFLLQGADEFRVQKGWEEAELQSLLPLLHAAVADRSISGFSAFWISYGSVREQAVVLLAEQLMPRGDLPSETPWVSVNALQRLFDDADGRQPQSRGGRDDRPSAHLRRAIVAAYEQREERPPLHHAVEQILSSSS